MNPDPREKFSAAVVSRVGTTPAGEIIRKETRRIIEEALREGEGEKKESSAESKGTK